MKIRSMCAALCFLAVAAPAAAQNPGPMEALAEPPIIVQGMRRDRAMQAFINGDFITAEQEFEKNLECVERQTMLQEFALEQIQVDSVRAEMAAAAARGGIAGASASGSSFAADAVYAPQVYNLPRNPNEIVDRTCYAREWQIYMTALSQLQLGKLDEAKTGFSRVVMISDNEFLYDAHFRLGLLELMAGDVERADQQLRALNRHMRSCRNRGRFCEVLNELEAYTDYLRREIRAARRERR